MFSESTAQGLPAPLAGSMAVTAAIFVSYATFQDVIRLCTSRTRADKLSIPELAVAAAGAGFAASYIV
jgi:ornithine carrier protein